jgi:dienelactone hydrolase
MTEVIVFHHALGRTPGVLAFAERLRDAGHTVHVPDLYEGRTFEDLEEGVAFAQATGFGEIRGRGIAAADGLPQEVVYAGFSLGAMPAQELAQTRPGALGALLFHASVPPADLGGSWPDGLPLQIHVMEQDAWGDVEVGQALAEQIDSAELFLYPGSGHLFADPGTADYDAGCAGAMTERTLAFLSRLG